MPPGSVSGVPASTLPSPPSSMVGLPIKNLTDSRILGQLARGPPSSSVSPQFSGCLALLPGPRGLGPVSRWLGTVLRRLSQREEKAPVSGVTFLGEATQSWGGQAWLLAGSWPDLSASDPLRLPEAPTWHQQGSAGGTGLCRTSATPAQLFRACLPGAGAKQQSGK